MIILTKENILSYIKEHVPSLQLKEPIKVSMIGVATSVKMWKVMVL